MILSATFSKPSSFVEQKLGSPYIKIRFWKASTSALQPQDRYEAEFFTKTQSFRKHFNSEEFDTFMKEHAGTTFKAVNARTESEEITVMANRHGEVKTLKRKLKEAEKFNAIKCTGSDGHNKEKNYILKEGKPVPF